MKRGLVLFLVLFVVLSSFTGCVTTDQGRTKAQGTAVGATAGAVIGGVLGALLGDADMAILGASAGAAIGGAAGYAYGSHVAKKKAEYAKAEDWLDACILSLDATNKETKDYNVQLSKNIEDLDATTASLVDEYQNKKVNKAALIKEKNTIDSKLKEARQELDKANIELENQQGVLEDTKGEVGREEYTNTLDMKIATLKKYISELESNVEELEFLSNRMSG